MRFDVQKFGLVVVALVLLGGGLATAENERSEQAVKAAFLYNFTKFVEWPEDSLSNKKTDSLFTIGVLGSTPVAAELGRAVSGKTVRGRSITVKSSPQVSDLLDCRVLLVGDITDDDEKIALEILKTKPVLTVGESRQFLNSGGIIRFFISEHRVRFEVNAAAAGRAGLAVNAQLLRLSTPSTERAGR